jgi:nucleolar GTP-binding protein
MLSNDEWKQDVMPEIMEGHNIADWIDPEIEERLQALEEEEDRLAEAGHYEEKMEEVDEETMNLKRLAGQIMQKKSLVIQAHRLTKGKNRPTLTLKAKAMVRFGH